MSQGLTDDKSTLVQVMAWCRQATSHYLSQFWPRSMSPYGVTRPQWVNSYMVLGRVRPIIFGPYIWRKILLVVKPSLYTACAILH